MVSKLFLVLDLFGRKEKETLSIPFSPQHQRTPTRKLQRGKEISPVGLGSPAKCAAVVPRRSSRSSAHRQAEALEEELGQWLGHSASATAERENSFGGKGRNPSRRPRAPLSSRRLLRGQRKGRTERERTATAVVVLAIAGGAPTAGLGRRHIEPPGEPGGSSREEKRREAGETPPRRRGMPPSPAMGRRRAGRRGLASSRAASGDRDSGERGETVSG
jgi:hypothetical protein